MRPGVRGPAGLGLIQAQDRFDGVMAGLAGQQASQFIETDLGVDELARRYKSQGGGALSTVDPGQGVPRAAVVQADDMHGAEVPTLHVDHPAATAGLVVTQDSEGAVDGDDGHSPGAGLLPHQSPR